MAVRPGIYSFLQGCARTLNEPTYQLCGGQKGSPRAGVRSRSGELDGEERSAAHPGGV